MNQPISDPLLDAILRLRQLFPGMRFGQLVANLMTAAGCAETDSIWDVEDERLLAAAQRLAARNNERRTLPA
ncbi:MAG: hypothetical protein L0Y72_23845 [Gemmataceae bacterium]|nr:hypothetical protein [Gemmataceae bacterium]MCI0742078.1 hypothetical protein [Gemmataceae bacterium]